MKIELDAIEKRGRWRQGITSESPSDVMNVDDVPQDKENLPDSQPEDNDGMSQFSIFRFFWRALVDVSLSD